MAKFNDFPNLHKIEDNLYLGDLVAATSPDILNKFNVTHIVTIDTQPLPKVITDVGNYTCIYFEAADMPDVDLLSSFEEAILFIKKAIQTGAVLVHCFRGMSRSVTVVCAYLMEKYKVSSEEALTMVEAKRPLIGPNTGFVAQLQLFHRMNWKVDYHNNQYRLYLIQLNPSKLHDRAYFDSLGTLFEDKQLTPSLHQTKFKCKKCRMCLFSESNIFSHVPGQVIKWNDSDLYSERFKCTLRLFLTPLPWMDEAKSNTQGKILCPCCKYKLGFFNIQGGKCICEATMSPSFLINTNQVDQCLTRRYNSQNI